MVADVNRVLVEHFFSTKMTPTPPPPPPPLSPHSILEAKMAKPRMSLEQDFVSDKLRELATGKP